LLILPVPVFLMLFSTTDPSKGIVTQIIVTPIIFN